MKQCTASHELFCACWYIHCVYRFHIRRAVFHQNGMRIGAVGAATRIGDGVMNVP